MDAAHDAPGPIDVSREQIWDDFGEDETRQAPRTERDRIVRRFQAWLDAVLEDEGPPDGIAAELLARLDDGAEPEADASCDEYAMWSAITALVQEVKLQGRTFKRLSDAVEPLAGLPDAERRALSEMHALVEAAVRSADASKAGFEQRVREEADRHARESVLDLLLDLRDRFGRGLESARRCLDTQPREARARWLRRKQAPDDHSREVADALAKGCALSLERLDEALDQWHVRAVASEGVAFDPETMQAVEAAKLEGEAGGVADGTVLEVVRQGYAWHGEMYRTAQVKVARRHG